MKCLGCDREAKPWCGRGPVPKYCGNPACYRRVAYAANPEKEKEAARKWQAANPEKKRESNRRYRAANPEKIRETDRKYYTANPEKAREKDRKYYAANPEKCRDAARKCERQRKAARFDQGMKTGIEALKKILEEKNGTGSGS